MRVWNVALCGVYVDETLNYRLLVLERLGDQSDEFDKTVGTRANGNWELPAAMTRWSSPHGPGGRDGIAAGFMGRVPDHVACRCGLCYNDHAFRTYDWKNAAA
jgi:hypothetical protein